MVRRIKSPAEIRKHTKSWTGELEYLWPKVKDRLSDLNRYLQDLFNETGTNWRGFNARSTPISTYYCRLIAKFLAAFPDQLPRIEATGHPWFL